jgi:hypothetical protein
MLYPRRRVFAASLLVVLAILAIWVWYSHWNRYSDSELGVSFTYPSGWRPLSERIAPSSEDAATYDFTLATDIGLGNNVLLSVQIVPNRSVWAAYLEIQPDPVVRSLITTTTIAGYPAALVTWPYSQHVVINVGGCLYAFGFPHEEAAYGRTWPPQAPYDRIFATLRFLPTPSACSSANGSTSSRS